VHYRFLAIATVIVYGPIFEANGRKERSIPMKNGLAVLLVAMSLVPISCVFAQTPTAEVTGVVLDSSGAAISTASVRVTSQDTNVVSEMNTNQDGSFTIINLLPGRYTLTAEKSGFKTITLSGIILDVNQILTEKLTMQIGSTQETVTITGEAVQMQSSSAELGTTINPEMVQDLPMNGRNFTETEIDQPGVTPISTAQSSGVGSGDGDMMGIPGTVTYKVSINGQVNRSTEYFLDGIINSDFRISAYAYLPIEDTIDEFKIQSHNSDAEYGGVLGGVVNLATKGGTNKFHGSAWEYARSQIFDARNPFTGFCNAAQCSALASKLAGEVSAGTITGEQSSAILSSTPVSPLGYSQNEFGGTFGGPIIKNKTFFYGGYEGWRYSKPSNSFAIDPTAQELSGDFSGQVTPELIGTVNGNKSAVTPNQLYNPFAESGASSAVPFYCEPGTTGIAGQAPTPMPLVNPGAAFASPGYGVQASGGVPCNVIPSGLIDSQVAGLIQGYTSTQAKSCAYSPNYATNIDNCLDSRPNTDNTENLDARIDEHLGNKDTLFGRTSMFWDTNTGIVAGTTSISPTTYHAWNYGGGWDHAFTPSLILDARGGYNSKPYQINPVNPAGYSPETSAGLSGLSATQGLYLSPSSYPNMGNIGPELRGNSIGNGSASLTWIHGRHNLKVGAEYIWEQRYQSNLYAQFTYATTQTCPTNSSGNFACSGAEGNALASAMLDLPSGYTAALPQFDLISLAVQSWAWYVQDEWHVRPNLTVDLGLRYDYVPAVINTADNGETINALDLPDKQYIINGSASNPAYTTGCGSPAVPPCIPGGLSSIPDSASVVFSSKQPVATSIHDNVGPRLGVAWQITPKLVFRVGYGVYFDTMSARSQWVQNTLSGSLWPFTSGVSDSFNNAPIGATPSTTTFPICNSLASCGPKTAGYSSSSFEGAIGLSNAVVNPNPWAVTSYTNDPHYSDPWSQQWQFNIERQLTPSSLVSVAYVGSSTSRLDYTGKANEPVGPFCENTAQCATPVTSAQAEQTEYMPFSSTGWNYAESTGTSNYNALQAQYHQRFSNGLTTLVAYTWSKCLSTSNGWFNAENGDLSDPVENFFNPSLAYGICGFDTPQEFNVSGVYNLPFGKGQQWLTHGPLAWMLGNWDAAFSFLARSGQAFNPSWGGASGVCSATVTANCVPTSIGGLATTSSDPAGLSVPGSSYTGYSRPSVLPGCNLHSGQSETQWYNPNCFVSPASPSVGPGYGFGDAAIGGLRTQKFNQMDFSLIKNFPIRESTALQLRFEGFNVFNHVVWSEPGASISPTFSSSEGAVSYGSAGQISSIASTPRELQMAAKFTF
jgi:Carboxypeptidase regulatory-like domain/TonB dependent receptor